MTTLLAARCHDTDDRQRSGTRSAVYIENMLRVIARQGRPDLEGLALADQRHDAPQPDTSSVMGGRCPRMLLRGEVAPQDSAGLPNDGFVDHEPVEREDPGLRGGSL